MGSLGVICVTEVSQSDQQVVLGGRDTVATAFEPLVEGFAASIGASSGTPDVPSLCLTQETQICSYPIFETSA